MLKRCCQGGFYYFCDQKNAVPYYKGGSNAKPGARGNYLTAVDTRAAPWYNVWVVYARRRTLRGPVFRMDRPLGGSRETEDAL